MEDCTKTTKLPIRHVIVPKKVCCWSSGKAFVSKAGGLRFESRASHTHILVYNLRLATAATLLRKKLYYPEAQRRGNRHRKLVTRLSVIQ